MTQKNRPLTQSLVDNSRPSSHEYIIWDNQLRGYGLRIYPTGKAVFILQWRVGPSSRRMTLGPASNMTQLEAREAARMFFNGRPMASDKAPIVHVAFPIFAKEFLTRFRRNWKQSTFQMSARMIEKNIIPHFSNLMVHEITKADVLRWFSGMARRPGIANRSLPILSVMMREAETYGYRIDNNNPCKNITRYKRPKMERYLSHEEIARLGEMLDRYTQIMPIATSLIRMLLLTGCRRGELVNLKWQNVHQGRLSLSDSKTGPKIIHIAPQVDDILQSLPRTSDFVFPNFTCNGPITESNLNNLWNMVRDRANLKAVRLHDLRHTYASIAMRNGVHIVTLSRLLGHADTETTLKYAHFANAELGDAVRLVSSTIACDLGIGQKKINQEKASLSEAGQS